MGYALGFGFLVWIAIVAPPLPRPEWRAAVRVVVVAALAYGFLIEPRWLRLRERVVPLPGLHPDLRGLKVAHVSDIHFGATGVLRSDVTRMVRRVLEAEPDLIVLTGDYVARRSRYIEALSPLLRPLRPRLGAFAVLGNHDWEDPRAITNALTGAGFCVLNNDAAAVRVGQATVAVAGIADPATGECDPDRALDGVSPAANLVVLLAHSSDLVREANRHNVDLVLCGHTHGGQVRLLSSREGDGQGDPGQPATYTSAGVGHQLPFRFLCRPEVPILVLNVGERRD